ncbi:MAG: hypothetical protein Q4D16_24805 [Eubacteriales bacterium]|nr:hypothetical protein [Eubacteriales bacterium]
MKTTDLRGKDSFYTAERALEEICTGLQEDVGDAMSTAYIRVLETYSKTDNNQVATLDEIRQSEFKQLFIKELAKLLQGDSIYTYDIEKLNKEYVDLRENKGIFDSEKETLSVTNPVGKGPEMSEDLENGILLKNLKVIYVDPKGRASIIQTDIRLGIPKVQFPTPSTLPDLMNMIVVAGGGIICENQIATDEISIKGSVYAGLIKESEDVKEDEKVSILVKPDAKLSVSTGNELVCQGEVSVRNGGTFSSSGEMNLWAQGITLKSSEVELLGKTYIADDLTVESGSGKGSKVTIAGEYYGYGYPESAKASRNKDYYEDWPDAALSSAITINGKNTTMDLSGVQKLMLAGKNYIASSKVPSGPDKENKSNDIMTGESLTVKGTQLAYLAPEAILYKGEQNNPMTFKEYDEIKNEKVVSADNMKIPVEALGGKTLEQIGVDTETPVQTVFYSDNSVSGGGYVYFYLNFTDDTKAALFMQQQYANLKENMDKYLSFYFGKEDSGIRVKDAQAYIRYITNGNVLSYDDVKNPEDNSMKKSGALYNAADTSVTEPLLQEQKNYQNMWYAYNRKMISSYDLLKKKVEDSEKISHDETELSQTVFDNLVNEKEMVQFIDEHGDNNTMSYEFSADGLTAVMLHNTASSTFEVRSESSTDDHLVTEQRTIVGKEVEFIIDEEKAEGLRLVVCTGDVRIKQGVKFKGIIMAKGKITLESGANLISSPLEAAKIFQSQMATTNVSPKNFFWEGDKYVLGNSSTTNGDADKGYVTDTYDLADCVTYENWKKK